MRTSVLVAYATKRGSTREVAEAVAAVLREEGCDVDLQAAGEVRGLDGYDAVVIGAGLYVGRLHRDARKLLARRHAELARLPVAVFAMGPSTLEADDVAASRAQLDAALERVPDVEPVATAIFGGVVDPDTFPFPLNRLPASDARDWDAIRAWAREVAAALRTRVPVAV